MDLLLDAGNTHLKWALLTDDSRLNHFGYAPYNDLATFSNLVKNNLLTNIYGVIVAGKEKQLLIESAASQSISWQYSQKQALGILSLYQDPSKHGADRWFNVIGARGFHPEGALLIVSCGTAVTIDVLDNKNNYLGGCIMPGIGLMHSMLDQKTAQLHYPLGEYQSFPKNTPDALMSGIINAISGAIERQGEQLQAVDPKQNQKIIITGGNAKLIVPFLKGHVEEIDNLVLHGLARWIIK